MMIPALRFHPAWLAPLLATFALLTSAKDYPGYETTVGPRFSYPDDLVQDPKSFEGEAKWCLWLNSPEGDFHLFTSPFYYLSQRERKSGEGVVDSVMRQEFGNDPRVHFTACRNYFHLWMDSTSSSGQWHRHCFISRGEDDWSSFRVTRLEIEHQGGRNSEGMKRYEAILRSFVPFPNG